MKSDKLKKCMRCKEGVGKIDYIAWSQYQGRCMSCGITTKTHISEEQAREDWNYRVQDEKSI